MATEKTGLVIITGPSGAGKTEITNTCIEGRSDQVIKFITSMNRPFRKNEKHGRDYYGYSPEAFKEKIQRNHFFEYEEVYDNGWYGFEREELLRIKKQGKHALAVADVNGALKFIGRLGSGFIDLTGISVKVIYIASQKDDMIARIRKDIEEGKRNDSEEKIQKRIERMNYELDQMQYFDNIIKNEQGKFEFALNDFVNRILHG
jgi:guanylate kinase